MRGKSTHTRIYQPICYKSRFSSEDRHHLKLHKTALENYYAKRYDLAVKQFGELGKKGFSPDYYQRMIDQSTLPAEEL